jgi:hypothetical protein
MKLFVFIPSIVKQSSIICETASIIRLTVLLEGGTGLWKDSTTRRTPHTADSIKAAYLTPNGIPVAAMGELSDAPGTWWVCADAEKLRMEDFYTAAEAEAAGIYAEDPTALVWKDHYIFLHDTTHEDLVGSLDYLGEMGEAVKYVLKNLLVV